MRRAQTLTLLLLLLAAGIPACSHEALTFWFDGVPEPGSEHAERPSVKPGEAPVVRSARSVIKGSSHPPVQQQQCGRCHSRRSLTLIKPPEEGLCNLCHDDVPGDRLYLHGPVAVNACLICHDPHGAPNPSLLRQPPTRLCTSCHDPDDLGQGEQHDADSLKDCTSCHDPHGGQDPFFLRRKGS